MKVAIVADPYAAIPPKNYGGAELVISELIHGLKEAGHEPIVLASADSEIDCRVVPICDKAVPFPNSPVGLPHVKRQISAIRETTTKELEKLLPEIDIIHSHSHADRYTKGFDMRPFADFPHVITVHNPIIFEELPYYRSRPKLNYISISENQREAEPDLNWIGTVYNGENPHLFPFVKKPDNYVCFLGRFDRDKNPHLAIQLAISAGIPIKLAGKVDFFGREYFESEVKPLLKHPLVEFLGELGFKNKVKLLANAKCNLHPTSFREPFGLTVLEAAYCGTPTLAIERGSMPELIKDGQTGALVEDFVEGESKLQQCFEMNRKYISKRSRLYFNYQKMTHDYLKAYDKALKLNSKLLKQGS